MIRQLILGFALAAASVPMHAAAKEFAEPGTVEVGGSVSLTSGSTKYKPDGGSSATENYTIISLSPTAGYFVSDGFEVLGRISVGTSTDKFTGSDSTSSTSFAIGAGGGYYVKAGSLRVGPDLVVGFTSTNDDNGGGDKTDASGPEVRVGATVKSPVGAGSGGVVNLGLHYDYQALDLKDTFSGTTTKLTETVGDVVLDVGFTVFF